jgi:hypothetical protein
MTLVHFLVNLIKQNCVFKGKIIVYDEFRSTQKPQICGTSLSPLPLHKTAADRNRGCLKHVLQQ